ncbi:MAG: hypothetical protein NC037_04655 [Bacteroides sp.]|nr:hypothetical protein [Bacillota bacterium]MCM1393858.1 hypothetical protein [[Eubacterium] siraeum]MCM1455801.1 hypothetical protein [Bacteroides sp.]
MANEVTFISESDIAAVNAALTSVVADGFDGVEVVEVKFFKQYGTPAVELLIWKKGGVTLNDCEAVHNVVSAELDKFDAAFSEAYNLNVSSLGLDRKIVTDDDFRRALDTEIECIDSNKKKIHGVLKAYDSENIVLSDGAHEKNIKRNILTKVQPYVRF